MARVEGKNFKVALPDFVLETFERDLEVFKVNREVKGVVKKNFSGLCNRIFKELSNEFLKEKFMLNDLINDRMLDNTLVKAAEKLEIESETVERLKKVLKRETREILNSVFQPVQVKYQNKIYFRLNNENMLKYNNIELQIGDNFTAADYFRSIFIAYALKQPFEREKILNRDIINEIKRAYNNGNKILMSIKKNPEKFMKNLPIFIKPSKEGLYTYLYVIDERGKERTVRLSNIDSLMVLDNEKFSLSPEEKDRFREIKRNFDPFVGEEEEEIEVYLSDKGKQLYEKIAHLRPKYTNIAENGNLIFENVSKYSIINYFLRLGAEAKIVRPKSLTREMEKYYKKAFEGYKELRKLI